MKKFLFLVILFLSVSVIIFCNYNNKENEVLVNKEETKKEEKAIFISYIDYSNLLKNKDVNTMKQNIDKMINNVKESNLNLIILQVRPFSDAIYNSDIFLSSKTVVENEGDPLPLDILDYFIKKSHENNIKIFAWINPYRIRTTSSLEDLNKNSFYYNWLDTNKVEITDNGIYLNPADSEVLDVILKGVEEIVKNYEIDGILYDDYFYPSKTIDESNYSEYVKNGGNLSISDYRIDKINNLIYKTNETIKKVNKDVLFGISPSGNINNNLNDEYLDIKYILENKNYLDFVMPQIYYGFENENMPFIKVLNDWSALTEKNSIKLYVALALYKAGNEDKYALSGKKEWIENNDIIKKQIIISRSVKNYQGFAIFRYEYLYDKLKDNENLEKEVINLTSIIE